MRDVLSAALRNSISRVRETHYRLVGLCWAGVPGRLGGTWAVVIFMVLRRFVVMPVRNRLVLSARLVECCRGLALSISGILLLAVRIVLGSSLRVLCINDYVGRAHMLDSLTSC